jgi:sugar lactone lactonase YvrE
VENRKIFIDMNSDMRPGNPDGMKVDTQGNVWDSGPGASGSSRRKASISALF